MRYDRDAMPIKSRLLLYIAIVSDRFSKHHIHNIGFLFAFILRYRYRTLRKSVLALDALSVGSAIEVMLTVRDFNTNQIGGNASEVPMAADHHAAINDERKAAFRKLF
jgi:hypothetical protein